MRWKELVYRVYYKNRSDGSTSYIDSNQEEIQRILDYLWETWKDFMYATNVEKYQPTQEKITLAKQA